MEDCKRMAVMDSSTADEHSPSKRRKILAASPPQLPPTMLHHLCDSQNFKLLRSTNSCSDEHLRLPLAAPAMSSTTSFLTARHFWIWRVTVHYCRPRVVETVYSTPANNKFSRETTPSSELCLENSDEMESPAVCPILRHGREVRAKRFAEKYNFDIGKDAPLEGRYEWIRLKP
ncbi:hypothetical protein M0R45_007832 [Rubus argutus]|uniref:Cyclin-dependent kinase inhibitor domain-containing protein n=1 Tax=Rubus argutus TaxID=59490 RepID=A0AAW1Y1T6_RUBAR